MDPFDSNVIFKVNVIVSCHVHSEKIFVLKQYTCVEQMKMMFPSSSHWVDTLVHLTIFCHAEGRKLKPKFERSHSSCSKTYGHSNLESTIIHEDEALFGNLFSEDGCTNGSTDELRLPSSVVNNLCVLSYCNMHIKAASKLLSFLKQCIFSQECPSSIYKDACEKLGESRIHFLLSILNCQACLSEAESALLPSQRLVAHIN
ncbi:hypothetical protein GIB67_023754 [Kingdonia uniflora]|uniref:Uncharacterized protein n=1 Tax=Kingdonia uniflora TaxID=39325 RepID=A0A7J7LG73_9MAGN|nr:hypothetical protein GIB67_023754 [Kingdonia uniflora]